ncbi:hypothetical protein [Pedobacter sp. MR22-3]|uniref:hypothetical protein n=1 Tax=Pedobacter sp. MR22-3 TaxID=2994552 RepID=UPI002245AC27|nr:hypothetical protein [Pedobacter sp. MR22-3]MCX2586467.1 hypothetical protein [Pedobacter sp. MR22-3]
MEVGKYYYGNQSKLSHLTDNDWKVALAKCEEHIKWKLKQKTLSGAHAAANLGADPIEHYLGIAYEKVLTGEWEWKDEFTLSQQLIRIADSYISKEVVKATSPKGQALKIEYTDIEEEFYDLAEPPNDENENQQMDNRLKQIEDAATGDENLEFMIEGLKEGKKRSDIAELLGINVRQLDKLREKLMRRVQKTQSSTN